MKVNRLVILIFSFVCVAFVSAQNKVLIDSLVIRLNNTTDDSVRINIYNELSWEWSEYDAQKAIAYSRKAIALAKEKNNEVVLLRCYNRMGNALDYATSYDSAFYYYSEALNICHRLHLLDEEGYVLINLGGSFFSRGKLDEALSYFVKAANVFEKTNDIGRYANALNNIGVVYRKTGDFRSAVYTYHKALAIKKKQNDTKGLYRCYVNLVVAYHELENMDSAFLYADRALECAKQIGEPSYTASVLAATAPLYQEIKQYSKAISLLKEALQLIEHIDNSNDRVRFLSELAEVYEMNHEYENSLKTHQDALVIAKELEDNAVILRSLSGISDMYAKQGNFHLAYDYKRQYVLLKDSIEMEKVSAEMNEMKTRFATELKDKEIAQTKTAQQLTQMRLDKEITIKRWFLGVLIAVFFITCVLFYFFRQRSIDSLKIKEQKQKIEIALSEKEALLREIHHRVKNNLQIISGLLELQEARSENSETKKMVDEAQNRIKSMSITHEMLYQTSDLSAIDLEEYVTRLVRSVEVSYARNYSVEKQFLLKGIVFNIDTIIPLGLILNELLTNSYKYAFRVDKINKLFLSIEQRGNVWQLCYEDNGDGLPHEITNSVNPKSFGLRLIHMLVRQLKGKIEYKYNNGATFIITFQAK